MVFITQYTGKMKHRYDEYINNSKQLFIMLFGQEKYDELINSDLKSIDWQGIDVSCSDILATFPDVKERFTKEWIEHFKENTDVTLFEMFIQVIFHYGYQQCYDRYEPILNKVYDLDELKKRLEEVNNENLKNIDNETKND